jgi:hypothetical protein
MYSKLHCGMSIPGKWRAPMVANPNYKGKWSRRTIPNPDYFEDKEPFKMTPIVSSNHMFSIF